MVFIFMVSVTLKIRVGVKKSYEICCVPSLLRTWAVTVSETDKPRNLMDPSAGEMDFK